MAMGTVTTGKIGILPVDCAAIDAKGRIAVRGIKIRPGLGDSGNQTHCAQDKPADPKEKNIFNRIF
jgi:hypothetical protein